MDQPIIQSTTRLRVWGTGGVKSPRAKSSRTSYTSLNTTRLASGFASIRFLHGETKKNRISQLKKLREPNAHQAVAVMITDDVQISAYRVQKNVYDSGF